MKCARKNSLVEKKRILSRFLFDQHIDTKILKILLKFLAQDATSVQCVKRTTIIRHSD